jgi:hypothetical protein
MKDSLPKLRFHFVQKMNKVIKKNWFTGRMKNEPVHVRGTEAGDVA